jgi:hypothetical protein
VTTFPSEVFFLRRKNPHPNSVQVQPAVPSTARGAFGLLGDVSIPQMGGGSGIEHVEKARLCKQYGSWWYAAVKRGDRSSRPDCWAGGQNSSLLIVPSWAMYVIESDAGTDGCLVQAIKLHFRGIASRPQGSLVTLREPGDIFPLVREENFSPHAYIERREDEKPSGLS